MTHENSSEPYLNRDSLVVALGRPERTDGAPLNPPISMSSSYIGTAGVTETNRVYARFSSESWEGLELAIGTLEGAEQPGLAYASGLAAVSAVFDLVPGGGTVVVPAASYNGTIGLARALADEGKFVLREVNSSDTEATIAALDGADLLWLESPTNPLLEVVDVPRLVEAARARGVLVAVDNTFSTPLRQNPLDQGVDIVVHSATKFIAGHSDLLLGLVVAKDAKMRARLHSRRNLRGSVPGSVETWLALRGLRTLAVRLDRAEESAQVLAERLAGHPAVTRVRYPGLVSDPNHERASRLLRGYGAMISIEIGHSGAQAEAFVDALRLVAPATSLGGVESLAERRRRHPTEPIEVPDNLVRLSIGIENVEDLWNDISASLAAAVGE